MTGCKSIETVSGKDHLGCAGRKDELKEEGRLSGSGGLCQGQGVVSRGQM